MKRYKNNVVQSMLNTFKLKNKIALDSENYIPYLCNYYYKPRIKQGDDIIIPLYITDYWQTEYFTELYNELFTIEYTLNGEKTIVNNIPIGEYELNVGSSNVLGDNLITIQAIDSRGRKSCRLFKSVMIIDDTYEITTAQTKTLSTDELAVYGIKINSDLDVDGESTRLGFTTMMNEIKSQGYRKVIIPTNIYKINCTTDRSQPIKIPSNFTLDLNGSTIKLQVSENNTNQMMTMTDCYDSHVINGTIEGDYWERYNAGTLNGWDSEGMNCFKFINDCKYCSMENVNIKYITGYANATSGGGHKNGRIILKNVCPTFTANTTIDDATGEEKYSNTRSTSTFIDLSPILVNGNDNMSYFNYSYMGGIMGANDFRLWYSFYDKDYLFIDTICTTMYRRIKIPSNAKYLKMTVIHPQYTPDIMWQLVDLPIPTNCAYTNIIATETRTCAFNPNHCLDMDLSNIQFIRCACDTWGSNPTPVPIDIEDGWFSSNDFYFRNLTMVEKSSNSSAGIIVRSGFNIVFDNCDGMGATELGTGVNSTIIKNCKNSFNIKIAPKDKIFTPYAVIKDNNIIGGMSTGDTSSLRKMAYNCTITNAEVQSSYLKNCTIDINDAFDTSYARLIATNVEMDNCDFRNYKSYNCRVSNLTMSKGNAENLQMRLQGIMNTFNNVTMNNIDFIFYNILEFNDCNITDIKLFVELATENDIHITFNRCTINLTDATTALLKTGSAYWAEGRLNMKFNECVINRTSTGNDFIYLYAQGIEGEFIFNNCTITNSNECNFITEENGAYEYTNFSIKLINTELPANILIDNIKSKNILYIE